MHKHDEVRGKRSTLRAHTVIMTVHLIIIKTYLHFHLPFHHVASSVDVRLVLGDLTKIAEVLVADLCYLDLKLTYINGTSR